MLVKLDDVLKTLCEECNRANPEDHCEPDNCRIRNKLKDLPIITPNKQRERAMWIPYYNGGLDRREYRCSKCWAGVPHNKNPRCWYCGSEMLLEM